MAEGTPALTETPETEKPKRNFWQEHKEQIILVAAAVVILVVVVLGLVWLTSVPSRAATLRDLAIIFMAVVAAFIGLCLLALIYQLAMLTQLLRNEIKPLLESAQETMNTLRGTAAFMSENLVEPTITASSTVAGARRVVEALLGLWPGSRRKS